MVRKKYEPLTIKFFILVKHFTATGWGLTDDFATEGSLHLMKVDLPGFNKDDCAKVYGVRSVRRALPSGILEDTQICVGGVKNKDSCKVS